MIAIRLVSQAGEAPATALEATFGDAGGDIGRGADCTLVLPDPERRISRKHLQVACRDGRYFLRLISNNLMVELDGVPLAPGGECVLNAGAQIRIGPFVLRTEGQTVATTRSADAARVAPARESNQRAAEDALSFFDPPGPVARTSVFHDLLHSALADARPEAPAARVSAPLEIDLVVGEDPTGAGERVAPPTAMAAMAALEPRQATAPAAGDLIEALYAGLGIPSPEPAARSAAQIELIGALLRACVSGTFGLLAARTIAKRELGASPTLIQTRQNNPLKFSPDANVALAQLVGPPRRGFVTPLAAVQEAFDDLRAHEVAVLAGMRAALSAALDRLNPATLELRLSDKGMWDNLLPVSHKAKLWERYSDQHAELAREIEEHFDALFAGAFIEAYEAQLARLNRSS